MHVFCLIYNALYLFFYSHILQATLSNIADSLKQ